MRKIILTIAFLMTLPVMALASEVTGTVNTGVSTGISASVATTPAASPASGTYTSAQSVSLTAVGSDSIRYIIDGATPTCSSGTTYAGAIAVSTSQTVRAVACYGGTASAAGIFAYVINIPAAPSNGGGGGGGGGSGGGGGGGGGGISLVNTGGGSSAGQVLGASTSTVRINSGQGIATATAPAGGNTGESAGGQVLDAAAYRFAKNIGIGSRGTDVTELQKILIASGFLKISAPTGYFGTATKSAVVSYQKAHNINPASGYVGGLTRAVLNGGTTPAASDEKASMIRKLQDQLKALLAKIAALTASSTTTATSTHQ